MKLIKRKLKKVMRSNINRRLFRSFGKLGIFFFGFSLIFSLSQTPKTNSSFFDSESSIGNNLSAGYWAPPQVEITSPEGGDEWQIGSDHDIEWTATSSDPAATAGMLIDINYRCNSGSWYNIVTGTENDGSYSVTVPAGALGSCEFRVFATDSHGLTGMDDSDEFDVSYMVVLNEFVPHPASGLDEMVEIYNYGTEPIDVDNWFITDDSGPASHRRVIDSAHTDTGDTVIDPGTNRFLVIENYSSFYLNDTGSDEVRLYDDASNLIDSEGFDDAPEGKSYARVPDGVGNWVDPVPTPGEKNDPSNDPEDMKDFYEKACFDEDDEPICKESFLKSLGLLDDESTSAKSTADEEDESEGESTSTETMADEELENADQVENLEDGEEVPVENESEESSSDEQDDSDEENDEKENQGDLNSTEEGNSDESEEVIETEESDSNEESDLGEESEEIEEENEIDDEEEDQIDENSEEDEAKEEEDENEAKEEDDEDETKKEKEDEDEDKEKDEEKEDEDLEEDDDEDDEKDQEAKKEEDEDEEDEADDK